ncbi:uncharacterized protein LOC126985923 isoform X2 [Eriocheir sinensis]|uniref:uncharacterized protein LOC126985923 isoform X2 n=1 Tax=Eriocheir sinensis TaxID=95602 RepID=UPI0021CA5759|nr:uncharacterized protein LOC126985923 isoform X2 [Eriocheir sinensis]
MKPGGLCSPGSGRPLPPREGVGAAPLPNKLPDGCTQFPKDPAASAAPRESRACLTPELCEEGSPGGRHPHGPLNGLLSQVPLLNGAYPPPLPAHRECHVLSPPQSEDGDEDGTPQHGAEHRTGGVKAPTQPPSLPSICSKRYEQLTVITADPRGRDGAITTSPAAAQAPLAPGPGSSISSSSAASPSVLAGLGGLGLGRGGALSSPRSLKSPRGRRKCSLEEIMTRLHQAQAQASGLNALANFPAPGALPPSSPGLMGGRGIAAPPAPAGPSPAATTSTTSTTTITSTTTTTTCSSTSIAPLPGAVHPRGQVTQGPGLRTPQGDGPPSPSVPQCSRTPSVVSDSVAAPLALCGPPPGAPSEGSVALGARDPGEAVARPPTPQGEPPRDTRSPTQTGASVTLDVSVCAPAVLNPTSAAPPCASPGSPAQAVPKEDPTEAAAPTPSPTSTPDPAPIPAPAPVPAVAALGEREGEGGADSPAAAPSSGRSSSLEGPEAEAAAGSASRTSESDIEVLFDGTTATATPQGEDREVKAKAGKGGPPKAVEGPGLGASPFLEPISDEENSLLTSDLSSTSGHLSSSHTPMFSDTPSDTSRGALMVKISDAVAAILSDVSDDSLPESPQASGSSSSDGFPSAASTGAAKLSRRIASICDKLDRDCGRDSAAGSTPTHAPAHAQAPSPTPVAPSFTTHAKASSPAPSHTQASPTHVSAPSPPPTHVSAPSPPPTHALTHVLAPSPPHTHALTHVSAPSPPHTHALTHVSAPSPPHTHIKAPSTSSTHAQALLPTPTHTQGLLPTPTHIQGLLPTPSHTQGLLPTPTHIQALLPTPTHIQALLPTPTHAPVLMQAASDPGQTGGGAAPGVGAGIERDIRTNNPASDSVINIKQQEKQEQETGLSVPCVTLSSSSSSSSSPVVSPSSPQSPPAPTSSEALSENGVEKQEQQLPPPPPPQGPTGEEEEARGDLGVCSSPPVKPPSSPASPMVTASPDGPEEAPRLTATHVPQTELGTKDYASTPLNTSEDYASTPLNTSEDYASTPLNTSEAHASAPRNTSEDYASTPMNASNNYSSLETSRNYASDTMRPSDDCTSAPLNTGKDYDSAPLNTGKDYDSVPLNTGKDYDSAPLNTGKDYDSAPLNTGKDYDSAPLNTGKDNTSAPLNTGEDYDSAPLNTGKDNTSAPLNTGEDYDSAPLNTGEDYDSAPLNTGKDNTSAPLNTGEDYTSAPLNTGITTCQNLTSGSRTISSQSRFCNILSGQEEKEEEEGAAAGDVTLSPQPPVKASPGCALPSDPPEPPAPTALSPKSTHPQDLHQGSATSTDIAPGSVQVPEGSTKHSEQPHVDPCVDAVTQGSEGTRGVTPPPTTTTTNTTTSTSSLAQGPQDQSSIEGQPSSPSQPVTQLHSDPSPQEEPQKPPLCDPSPDVPETAQMTPVEPCPKDTSGTEQHTHPGGFDTGHPPADPPDSSDRESHAAPDSASSEPPVAAEEQQEGGGGGCVSLPATGASQHTQVPRSVGQTDPTQHPTTAPTTAPLYHTPPQSPVTLASPAPATAPDAAPHDPDSSSTSAPPRPSPPGTPPALCSLGEATTPGLVVPGEGEAGEAPSGTPSPGASPQPPTTQAGDSAGGGGEGHSAPQPEVGAGHRHSLPCTAPAGSPQPPSQASPGGEGCLAQHTSPADRPQTPPPAEPSPVGDGSVGPLASPLHTLPAPASPPEVVGEAAPEQDTQPPVEVEEIPQPPVEVEETPQPPRSPTAATQTQPEEESAASGRVGSRLLCALPPGGEASTPLPAVSLGEEQRREGLECAFPEAHATPSNPAPGPLPSVKSPTVGVTPDEVTIPQGEPHTALTLDQLASASGAKAPSPEPSPQGHEEGQTLSAAVVGQSAPHSTPVGQEGAPTPTEDTSQHSPTQQPHTTEPATAAPDTSTRREGVPQILLDLGLVKSEAGQAGPGLASPTQARRGLSLVWPTPKQEVKPVCSSTEAAPATSTQEEGAPCPLCLEPLAEPLEQHLTSRHVCCTFVPVKTTLAFQRHMLLRVRDPEDLPPGEDPYPGSLHVCRRCCFASQDINAVRFHLNSHEEVYQVRPGQVACDCDQRTYAFPSHRWRSLMHRSAHHCHLCGHYFACPRGLALHALALHCPGQRCQLCSALVDPQEAVDHLAQHRPDHAALEPKQEPPQEPPGMDRFGVAWNIYDNWINFLDGKDFRLSTAPKVPDPGLDRSYLTLPLRNVDEEAVVPPEAILDPGRDIHRYVKNKRVVRLPGGGEEALRSFSLAVQLDLHKKMNRKGRKAGAGLGRGAHRQDLFSVLGIAATRPRAAAREAAEAPAPRTPGRKPRRKLSLEIPLDEAPGDGPQLTRTRSGMMQMPRAESLGPEGAEESPAGTPTTSEAPVGVSVVEGEWSREHTYVCCSCGASCHNLADMMDHKWEMHPAVWCAHTMLQGQGQVPHAFRCQFQPPTARPTLLPLPTAPPPSSEGQAGPPSQHTPAPHTCTGCGLTFQERPAFHAHLVECGGLSLLVIPKKKSKKGFRFKRRKGQGMPNNRYGNMSQPSTPLKARAGDRSSGLNTPLMDRPMGLPLTTCGVKRRLELAVGSIDNVELKNRLKAIITSARGPGGGPAQPIRRHTKMKLRKKALDTRRLRKTRHSDRVKELKEEKAEVSGEDGKGKLGKKGTTSTTTATTTTTTTTTAASTTPTAPLPDAPKPPKGKGKRGKKSAVIKVEEGQVGVSGGPSGTVLDVEKWKGKVDAGPDTSTPISTLPVSTKKTQRMNGFLEGKKKVKKKKKKVLKAPPEVPQMTQIVTHSVPEPPIAEATPAPPPPQVPEKKKKKGKKAMGKRKGGTVPGTGTEVKVEVPGKTVKGTKKSKKKLDPVPVAPPSPLQPPQEPAPRPRKVRRTSSVETSTSSAKEEEETTVGEEEEELVTEDSEWVSDSKDSRARPQDALRPKRPAYFSSSSDDTENSDSEPEVIRNFRSGRRCGGRLGLRTKQSKANARYSFRTASTEAAEAAAKGKARKGGDPEEEEEEPQEKEVEELPLTPKRKRKVANYENQDDYLYVPPNDSASSDAEALEDGGDPARPRGTRRSMRTLLKDDPDTQADARAASTEAAFDALKEAAKTDSGAGAVATWTPGSIQASARSRRRSLEVAVEGAKAKAAPRTASAPSSDLEVEGLWGGSKGSRRKGPALLERLALSSAFQAQVDEVSGIIHRRKKAAAAPGQPDAQMEAEVMVTALLEPQASGVEARAMPGPPSALKDTDEEGVREASPGREGEPPPKVLRRRRLILSEHSASEGPAQESDSSLDKPPLPGRRRNVILSSDCSEAEARPAAPLSVTTDAETPTEEAPEVPPPRSLPKKMPPTKKAKAKGVPRGVPALAPPPGTPGEEEDDEDDVPLSALAHSGRKADAPAAPPGLGRAAAKKKKKVYGKSKKRLKMRQLSRLIKEAAAQDSESSSFEGFSGGPAKRWPKAKAKAPTKKYKKKLSLLKAAKAVRYGSTASESEVSDDTRTVRRAKLRASALITSPAPDPAPAPDTAPDPPLDTAPDPAPDTATTTTTTATTPITTTTTLSQPEEEVAVAPPAPPAKGKGKGKGSHKKGKSHKKHFYKKKKKSGGKGVRQPPKGPTQPPGPPHTMPVLECMAGPGGGQADPPPQGAAPEPARVSSRRSSADPAKDIPVVPPTQPPSTTTQGEQALPSPLPLPPGQQQPVERPATPPQPRRKRAKSTQEAPLRDQAEALLPPPPPPAPAPTPAVPQGQGKGKRKRSTSVSGAGSQEAAATQPPALTSTQAPALTSTQAPALTASKKGSEGSKKKKKSGSGRACKAEVNEVTCMDCGLKFGSLASLEDHRQDCLTIAFEMSMMEAEDHLFECPHCHLTFAKKGTQRKHTTSCRLVKYKRYESKAFKKASRVPPAPPALLLPGSEAGVVGPPAPLPSPGKGRKSSKENISREAGPGAADPLLKEVLRVPVYTRHGDKAAAVLTGGGGNTNTLQENVKHQELLPRVPPITVPDPPKVWREGQLNGRLLNGEHPPEPFPPAVVAATAVAVEPQRCAACGYDTSDPDLSAKHRLVLQFSRCCQQQAVKEVCALAANYNLGLDAVRGMVAAAEPHQGFITLAFDPKQAPIPPLVGGTASTTAKLKEVLASPHCAWVLSSLESLAKRYQASEAVSITGSRQDALKTLATLEEVLRDISETDGALLRNRMLKTMRENFEAGTN